MTYVLLAILSVIIAAIAHYDRRAARRERALDRPPALGWPPRIDGMVSVLGFAGRAILLETPRGVELEIDGDTIPLDDCLDYLADVDAL